MLRWNPDKRPTAQQALKYSYFTSMMMTPDTGMGQSSSLLEMAKRSSYVRQNGSIPAESSYTSR
jgi:hypothetical protein